jgi:RNA polymerase sigma factor (sigma-70 family)
MRERDAEIYAKHADELVRFATVLVGPSAAEDVVADAVTRAFRSPGWPSVENRRAYLFRATLNAARQACRSDWRRVRRDRCLVQDSFEPDGGHVRVEVLDAMRRLTPRQRAVVFFTYWQDLECDAVAALLRTSTRTVQRELTAARRRLEVLLHD